MKKFLIQAFTGFALWTILLTPYMLLITKVNFEQYLFWLLMQAIIVPIIAPIVFRATSIVEAKILSLEKAKER
jgi:hypothetical protein